MHLSAKLLSARAALTCAGGLAGAEEASGGGDGGDMDRGTMHRLCPTYAQDINSPLRHVRTRIYFTSESHVHSLVNVLRFSHLGESPVLAPSARWSGGCSQCRNAVTPTCSAESPESGSEHGEAAAWSMEQV